MPRAKPDRPGAAEAARQNVAEAIARRAGNLTPSERRRLGRWTSATLRDPRLSRELNAARNEAQRALDRSPERKRYWERVRGPLYQSLGAASGDDRRFRLVMLAGHFVALLALHANSLRLFSEPPDGSVGRLTGPAVVDRGPRD